METSQPTVRTMQLPRAGWVILLLGAVIAAAWLLTWWTAADYGHLLMMQVAGAAPTDTLLFVGLSGAMMVAMMLPSALPMVRTYGSLARSEAGTGEGRRRTGIFVAGYFLAWTAFAAVSLILLSAAGLMGEVTGPLRYVPGMLLIAMGSYQLTAWKQFCLQQCRTPTSFVLTRWKSGRRGALRMGLDHASYCLGCCWLLMLVLFVAGAMSLLWMGVFSLLILGEKLWSRGELFSRGIGATGIAVGFVAIAFARFGP